MAVKVYGYILDIAANEGLAFEQNPTEFEEVYAAIWEERAALAAPHHRRQFKATANVPVTMDLIFNRKLIADFMRQMKRYDETTILRIMVRAKAFLQSLTVPRKHPGSVLVQSPPPVLLVWPGVLRIRANLDRVAIRNTEFANDASLVEFIASSEFVEQRTRELYSDDIRRMGSLRGN